MTPSLPLPPVQAYQPATFSGRGVAVPFTSPLLAGGRVRRGERVAVELVLPNPSGGRGVYILPWQSVRILFRPSVHDSRLYRRIATLPELTPASVRQASLDMACEGLAGRQAMAAALATKAKDEAARLLTSFLLLVSLAEQAEPAGSAGLSASHRPSIELERRARQVVARIAPGFDRSPQEILAALAELTDVFSPIGVAGQSTHARIPRLLEHLMQLRSELVEWAQDHADDVHMDLADMITDFAEVAVSATDMTLTRSWAATKDMAGLLQTWGKNPEQIIGLAARPAWLLDGWEQVCLLWRSSNAPELRRAALTEMAQLVPVLPRQLAEWVAVPAGRDDDAVVQDISLNKDWRTGVAVLHLTARNERMRAFAV